MIRLEPRLLFAMFSSFLAIMFNIKSYMNHDLPHFGNERGLRVEIMSSYKTTSKLELDT